MYNLLKVEFFKLKKFLVGYLAVVSIWLIGFFYGSYVIGYEKVEKADNSDIIFSYVVSDTSFVFLIALITAWLMGKDFSSRTVCNEIKLGYSRHAILFSKMIASCVLSVSIHVAYVVSTVAGFSVVRGFDTDVLCMRNLLWLLTVLIQLMAVVSGVVLITFLAKKSSEAIVLSTVYAFICCNILRNFFDSENSKIFTLSCFYFVQDSSKENLGIAVLISILMMALFLGIAVTAFRKADVK